MNISPVTSQPDIATQTGSGDTGAKASGFAELLDAAQAKAADGTATDPTVTDDAVSVEDTEGTEVGEPTEGEPVDDESAVPDDAASQLLAASLAANELLQPDTATESEVPPGTLNVADVTAELNANAAAKADAGADVEPTTTALDSVSAAVAAKQAAETAAVAVATSSSATVGEDNGDVTGTPSSSDTSDDSPVVDAPTEPGDAPAPTDSTGDPNATPELPIDPLPPAVPETARTDMGGVAEALAAVVDASVPTATPEPGLAPRVSPTRTESPTVSPSAAASINPIASPVNTATTPGASSTPVQVSATPTPVAQHTPPQEQVAAAIVPLHQRSDGVYRLRLELHPAELGYVEVDVELRNGVLSANLRAEHLSAAHALRDALADLRGRLESQGVRAGEMTVDGRGPGTAGRDRNAGGPGSARGAAGRHADDRGDDTDDPRPRPQPTDLQESVLDLRM
jgi:flagellar hook-length control protein FliK